jgi:sterol 14-demethylase
MTATPISSANKPVPRLAGGLPFFGHAIEFHRNPVGLIQRGRARYGDLFSFPLFGKLVNVLTGAAGNEAFFRAPDSILSPKEAYQFTVPIFGEGVAYDTSSEMMDAQLRMVHPALRDEKMQSYAHFIAAEVEAMLDSWGEAGEFDLLSTLNELTIRTAGRCLIGAEFGMGLHAEFARLYHDLEGGINMVAFFAPHLPLPAMLRRDRARAKVVKLMGRVIAARRASKQTTDDFLDALMAAHNPDGSALSNDTITGLLLTLLFAGQHTSAVLATWTGILLLQNPQWLPALQQEQQVTVGARGMSLAVLKQLVRLEHCIKETERLHPPLIMLMRTVLQDFNFQGHKLPKGTLAMVSPAVSHRIAGTFSHPDRYDPDRFAPPREEDRRAPYSLIGFGGGKHRCIGLAFAYNQVKVIWTILLRRYDFTLASQNQRPNYATFVVGPRQPCVVRYRRRANDRATPAVAKA